METKMLKARSTRILTACVGTIAVVGSMACGTEARTQPHRESSAAGRPAVAVTVTPATASDVTESVDVTGSLAPKFFADVKSEVSGTVTAVYVAEWVQVRKGDPLARRDTTDTDAAIE